MIPKNTNIWLIDKNFKDNRGRETRIQYRNKNIEEDWNWKDEIEKPDSILRKYTGKSDKQHESSWKRIASLEDKIEILDQIMKKYEIKFKTQEGNIQEMWHTIKLLNLQIIWKDKEEES